MTAQTITAETALTTLTAEGHDRADVLAAIDSLIDAGLELDQPEQGGYVLTAGEVDVLRDHLGRTITATADVVTGIITLDVDADTTGAITTDPSTGGTIDTIDVGPWGQDEWSMDRADAALAEDGLTVVSDWAEDRLNPQILTAQVTRKPSA